MYECAKKIYIGVRVKINYSKVQIYIHVAGDYVYVRRGTV